MNKWGRYTSRDSLFGTVMGTGTASEQAINSFASSSIFPQNRELTGNWQEHRPCRAPEETMNKWEQQRAVLDELLRMEAAGEVRQNPDTGQWETTEYGLQVAFEQMKQDFGALAPLVRLFDRIRAWWLRLSTRQRCGWLPAARAARTMVEVVDLAIFAGIWTYSSCRVLLNA